MLYLFPILVLAVFGPPILLAVGKAGTAKDVAEMAVELITGAEAPDDVLEALLHLLHSSKELSAKGKRAKYYRLTALGKRRLETERSRWEQMSRAIGRVASEGTDEVGDEGTGSVVR